MGSVVSKVTRFRGAGAAANKVNIKRPPVPEAAVKGKETLHQPDKELLGRLKDVYVSSSTDAVKQENPYGADRRTKNLPQNRTSPYEDVFNQSITPSKGYLSTKDVTLILQQPSSSSEEWTASRVAEVYGVSLTDAESLLKYFMGYKIVASFKDPLPEMAFHKLHE